MNCICLPSTSFGLEGPPVFWPGTNQINDLRNAASKHRLSIGKKTRDVQQTRKRRWDVVCTRADIERKRTERREKKKEKQEIGSLVFFFFIWLSKTSTTQSTNKKRKEKLFHNISCCPFLYLFFLAGSTNIELTMVWKTKQWFPTIAESSREIFVYILWLLRTIFDVLLNGNGPL